jgi:hypothetical protein
MPNFIISLNNAPTAWEGSLRIANMSRSPSAVIRPRPRPEDFEGTPAQPLRGPQRYP